MRCRGGGAKGGGGSQPERVYVHPTSLAFPIPPLRGPPLHWEARLTLCSPPPTGWHRLPLVGPSALLHRPLPRPRLSPTPDPHPPLPPHPPPTLTRTPHLPPPFPVSGRHCPPLVGAAALLHRPVPRPRHRLLVRRLLPNRGLLCHHRRRPHRPPLGRLPALPPARATRPRLRCHLRNLPPHWRYSSLGRRRRRRAHLGFGGS